MSIPTEDVFLETVIADTLNEAEGDPDHAATARRIIAAIAGHASEHFNVTALDKGRLDDHGRGYFDAATPMGSYSASGPSCTHFYSYSNAAMAGDPGDNPDDTDYLHICELDDFIATLVNLRELRRRYMAGDDVPVCDHSCQVKRIVDGDLVPEVCQCCGLKFGEPVPVVAVPAVRSEPAAKLTPKLMEPVTFVPCPGAPCASYLYGVDHQHTARPE